MLAERERHLHHLHHHQHHHLALLLLLSVSSGVLCRDADPPPPPAAPVSLPSPSEHNASSATDTPSPVPRSPAPGSPPPRPEVRFVLKALVQDLATRRPLQGASLDVYADRVLLTSARTGPDGGALLRLPYGPRIHLTLLARMDGYVLATLPWNTPRRPLFSAVTMRLLPHSQGNIWLYEDSVVITAKLPDTSSQPSVRFPKDLLTLEENGSVSALSADLTVPQHHLSPDCANCTPAIVSNQSAHRAVALRPAAALSVRLRSGARELQVRGPVHLSLPLGGGGGGGGLRASDPLPAWAFSTQTGAWEQQGLGVVKMVDGHLVWTYTASHLGDWIAAPLPSDNAGLPGSLDFLWDHTLLLVGLLGATLAVVLGFLTLLVCHCGSPRRAPRQRSPRARFSKLAVLKKDQTTSTHTDEGLAFPRGAVCDPSSTPRHMASYNIYVEDPGARSAAHLYRNLPSDRSQGARLQETSDHKKPDLFFQDKMVHMYGQQVAVARAPEPRGARPLAGPPRKPGFPGQALDKGPKHQSQSQSADDPRPLQTPPPGQDPNTGLWGLYNHSSLLESSVSVPGTLSQAGAAGMGAQGELQGLSERTLQELSRGGAAAAPPRAWFVSLEGRPAARVRHSIIEPQGRRRPASSNDTSMDSGVDLSERRPPGASSLPRHHPRGRRGEEADLSSSESATTGTCSTPEDPYLRDILDGSAGTIPDIPEERDGARKDGGPRETPPPPRRLRKGRAEKRSAQPGVVPT